MLSAGRLFDKSSHLNLESISLYVDALKLDKTDQLPERLLKHVAECEGCKREITELCVLMEDQEYNRQEIHPYFDRLVRKTSKGSWHVYRIAAALILGIGFGLIVYYVKAIRVEQSPMIPAEASKQTEASKESTSVAAKSLGEVEQPRGEAFASNFTESPNLEPLVNNELRSGSIQALSPLNGTVVGQRILFKWEGNNKGPFALKVLTNTETVFVSRTLSKPLLVLGMQLAPGLYYWKVESGGELLYVGKFLVK
jgi:hypothetical protein